ncbi:MAG: hypothetical protein C0404_10995, partial [Verrucomicrobia bacterium]|nr:hypothetical protein [Verrucomicrobiota bacterium]
VAIRNNAVRVNVSPSGAVSVDNAPVTIANLCRDIKAAGGNAMTAIIVSLPEGAQASMMLDLSRQFAAGGFPKVVFKRPVHKEAYSEAEALPDESALKQADLPARTDQPKSVTPPKTITPPKKTTSQKSGRS